MQCRQLKFSFIALFALIAMGTAYGQIALQFPPLSGRVVDAANIIPKDAEQRLTAKLNALETQNGTQFVIATVISLQGYDIADYGVRLARAWKLGEKDINNGILLLIAPNDRKVRIEVGYGLEETLTDALSSLIINQSILPAFRKQQMVNGIERGANDIVQVVSGESEAFKQRMEEARKKDKLIDTIVLTIFFIFFFGILAMGFLGRIFGKKVGRGRYKWGPITVTDGNGRSKRRGSRSSGGFSGRGGSFGGGGASGSW